MSLDIGGRSSRRVVAPPGGASSVVFGGPTAAQPNVEVGEKAIEAVEEVVETPLKVEIPEDDVETNVLSVEALKLKLIGIILSVNDTAVLTQAINLVEGTSICNAVPAGLLRSAPTQAQIDALQRFKDELKARGTHGILSIGKRFKSMDDDNSGSISFDEFKKAALEMNINVDDAEMMTVFKHFDADGNGNIVYDEFLVGLRGELNARRKDMVQRAFKVLDKTGDGQITLADLEGRYDASQHPDVMLGTKSEKDVLLEFLGVFEAQGGGVKGDGIVTFDEFCKYYSMISASIDLDDYFELMIRNAWHISGGEGWCANTTCKRVLVEHEDGTQSVVELTDDFDLNVKDPLAIKKKLEEQGVTNIKKHAVHGVYNDVPSSPTPIQRPTTAGGRRSNQHNSSSIVFG